MHTLTRQGDIGGSIGFISPDHIREFSDVREPADIYCAAATLFFLLTNKYPYLGFDPHEPGSYEMILQHPPVPLRAFRPDAPEGLERVLLKALQKQPRDRWKSAQAMAERSGRSPRRHRHRRRGSDRTRAAIRSISSLTHPTVLNGRHAISSEHSVASPTDSR